MMDSDPPSPDAPSQIVVVRNPPKSKRIFHYHWWDFSQMLPGEENEKEPEYVSANAKAEVLERLRREGRNSTDIDIIKPSRNPRFWDFPLGSLSPFSTNLSEGFFTTNFEFHLQKKNDGYNSSFHDFEACLLNAYIVNVLEKLQSRFLVSNPFSELAADPLWHKGDDWRLFYEDKTVVRLYQARILAKPFQRWRGDTIWIKIVQLYEDTDPSLPYDPNNKCPGVAIQMPLSQLYAFTEMISDARTEYHRLVQERVDRDARAIADSIWEEEERTQPPPPPPPALTPQQIHVLSQIPPPPPPPRSPSVVPWEHTREPPPPPGVSATTTTDTTSYESRGFGSPPPMKRPSPQVPEEKRPKKRPLIPFEDEVEGPEFQRVPDDEHTPPRRRA